MRFRLAALVAALVFAVAGCGGPSTTTTATPAGDKPGGDTPRADPSPRYALNAFGKQAGRKYEVVEAVTGDLPDPSGKGKAGKKLSSKTTYSEEVLEVKDGVVTKCRRAFGQAEGINFGIGELVKHGYVGKTVAIERKADGTYAFTLADGGEGLDAAFLNAEFQRRRWTDGGIQELLPTTPVKQDETWKVPAGKLEPYFGPEARWLDATGMLTKVSTTDGKRHGVITIRIGSGPTGPKRPDSYEWTYEGCIDEVAPNSSRKYTSTQRMFNPNRPDDRSADLVIITETTIRAVE